MLRNFTLSIISVFLLVGCKGVLEKPITADNVVSLSEEISASDAVSEEEKRVIKAHVLRTSGLEIMEEFIDFKGSVADIAHKKPDAFPLDKTFRQMIAEEAVFYLEAQRLLAENALSEAQMAQSTSESASQYTSLEVGNHTVDLVGGEVKISVDSIRKTNVINENGNKYSITEAKPNEIIYIAELNISNSGNEPFTPDHRSAPPTIIDDKGYTYPFDLTATMNLKLGWEPQGKVLPKGSKRGQFAFVVPASAKGLKIQPGLATGIDAFAYKIK